MNYSSGEKVFLGKDLTSKQSYSDEIAKEIDEEIKNIIEEAYQECEKILTENSKELNVVAEALLEVETLDGKQFMQLINGEVTPRELAANIAEMEETIAEKNRQEAEEMSKLVDEEEFYADIVRLSKGEGINQNFDFDNISSVGKDLSKDHEDAGREGTEKVAGNSDSEVATERNLEKNSKEEAITRSEEHTSELQSRINLVCRLLLEKKKCTMKVL